MTRKFIVSQPDLENLGKTIDAVNEESKDFSTTQAHVRSLKHF